MPYERLVEALSQGSSASVTALPDGSVDNYCEVDDGAGESIETREAFGHDVLGERTSFGFTVETTEPGGQAVNTAKQLHALGDDVTCYGHLDAAVFEDLPFETVSMGEPATVYVLNFTDRDVMLVRNAEVSEWTLADLRRVADLSTALSADAICCSNWASIPGLADAFHQLADHDLPRVPFVVDPGDIVGCDTDDAASLLTALAALQRTFDVVFNGNRQEVRTAAEPLDSSFDDDLDRLVAIREATGITAAVMHARREAAIATPDEQFSVGNYDIERPRRHTGGGDRFTAGLGHALACGWEWDVALACGNASAVYYVETGTTGSADDLASFVRTRPTPET